VQAHQVELDLYRVASSDIGHRVEIDGPDYHRLDRDGDGIGCDKS
jgi:hypothetical protein